MGGRSSTANAPLGDRAQTGFDFLVGMSVFLVTVGLVLSFAPGIFEPFDTGSGSSMVAADRSASLLASDLLVEDVDRPGRLNRTCTVDFFDGDPDAPDCRFEHNATELATALNVEEYRGLNVTVESSGTIATVGGQRLAAGASPPQTAEVVVGKRAVLVGETRGTLHVRVW